MFWQPYRKCWVHYLYGSSSIRNNNILSYARKCKFCTLTIYFTFLLCWKCNVHCWHVVQHLNESRSKLMCVRVRRGTGCVCVHCTVCVSERACMKDTFTNTYRDGEIRANENKYKRNPILSVRNGAVSFRALQFIWTCLNGTFYHRFGGDDVCHFLCSSIWRV